MDEKLVDIFKALANPNRLEIFKLIHKMEGKCCDLPLDDNAVCAIASNFSLALSTVSHHLKELKNAGLIRCERQGQSIYCRVEPKALEEIRRFFDELILDAKR
ncbi:MAG: helix-turn-helix transcriptional regulator [Candidatus Tectomicrobia bacterium]|uniref:Helix-turn-helix transcriptional regulator n=1 Tax=Tectimicrobiota bacterium TaxID=2528274 RepID=A0A933LQC0_UNCTE|nr:helix-turn-helix transcriptional regulator [Candidatus Tectomicrobia bacterium]